MILVLPVVFETEKLQMEQQQQLQQRQVRQEGPALSPGPAELAGSACTSRCEQLLREPEEKGAVCCMLWPHSSHQMLCLDVLMGQSC